MKYDAIKYGVETYQINNQPISKEEYIKILETGTVEHLQMAQSTTTPQPQLNTFSSKWYYLPYPGFWTFVDNGWFYSNIDETDRYKKLGKVPFCVTEVTVIMGMYVEFLFGSRSGYAQHQTPPNNVNSLPITRVVPKPYVFGCSTYFVDSSTEESILNFNEETYLKWRLPGGIGISETEIKCECGAESIGYTSHSQWCAKHDS